MLERWLEALVQVAKNHKHAEIGYWVGIPFWGQGFATEAAQRIVQFGFEDLELNCIFAAAMTKNPGSSNVMKNRHETRRGSQTARFEMG